MNLSDIERVVRENQEVCERLRALAHSGVSFDLPTPLREQLEEVAEPVYLRAPRQPVFAIRA